jgi:hypothetical protein
MAKRAKKDRINRDKIEREYGLSFALFKSSPELYGLLKKAVAQTWTADRFQVELRQTDWFKNHSDTWRQMTALRYSDPETFKQKLAASRTSVDNLAAAYGASGIDANALAERALLLGWNEDQIRDVLANHVLPSAQGHFTGQLSAIEQNLRSTASSNGISVSQQQLTDWMRNIVRGNASTEQYETMVRDLAAKTFSVYGEQIKAGMNLKDLASPYIQSMSQILELNPGSLDLFDPTVRKAMAGTTDDKGQPVAMSITDFENSLRNDRRWQYTKQAKDTATGFANALGRMWGLTS